MAYGSALSAAEDAPGTRKARGAFFTVSYTHLTLPTKLEV